MRIALLTDGITPFVTGGMQRHSYHLARQLLTLGIDLTLVHAVELGKPLPTEEEISKVFGGFHPRLIGLHFPVKKPSFAKGETLPGHYIRESYRYSCAVYESLENEWGAFDFIYAKGFTAWHLLERKRKGEHMAPVGVNFHGYEMYQKAAGLKEKLIQFMFRPAVVFNNREANVIFSYGGEITEIIKRIGVPYSRIEEIPSGVDDGWIAQSPLPQDGVRRFLFIGRFEKRKGLDDIYACRRLIGTLPVEFHFAGPIPDSAKLHIPNCLYHGEVSDTVRLRNIIDACQVLVAPSHAEGMPNAILEAMSRGLAVVATAVGAVPGLVTDENGLLIAPGDRKMLEIALERMARMPSSELDVMRACSIEKISKQYRWSHIAEATIAAIRRRTHGSR